FAIGGTTLDRFAVYRLVLVVMLVTAVLVANVSRSAWGRWMRALRASEIGTSALGISTYRAKLVAFVMAALFGGVAGGVYAHYQRILDPLQFSFELSVILFSALVIGGLGSLWAPALGAFLYVLGPHYVLPDEGGPWAQVLFGALLVLVMVVAPNGLASGLARMTQPITKRVLHPGPATPSAPTAPDALRTLLTRANVDLDGQEPVLAATDVTVRFGGVVALDGVDVVVHPGRITALIGPNGSGKTTLLNVCCGYVSPERGRVVLRGEDVTAAAPHRRAVLGLGRTFQGAIHLGGLSPAQNVMAGATAGRPSPWSAMLGLPAGRRHERHAAARAEAILDALGVGHLARRGPTTLSIGEERILGLARALALDPVVLALDEPVAGLDLAEISIVEQAIEAARAAGVGVLLVEHDVAVVTRVADRATVLHLGSVIFDGPPVELTEDEAVVDAYFGEVARV
ncbi:MAG: ATP-binding cassette domain-containing protein, partial [Acidimicrobiales bacterium]